MLIEYALYVLYKMNIIPIQMKRLKFNTKCLLNKVIILNTNRNPE